MRSARRYAVGVSGSGGLASRDGERRNPSACPKPVASMRGFNAWVQCVGSMRGFNPSHGSVHTTNGRAGSANANRASKTALRVDDLAALAGRHPLTEANGADLLTTADLVRVMHKETSSGSMRLTECLVIRKVRLRSREIRTRYRPEDCS